MASAKVIANISFFHLLTRLPSQTNAENTARMLYDHSPTLCVLATRRSRTPSAPAAFLLLVASHPSLAAIEPPPVPHLAHATAAVIIDCGVAIGHDWRNPRGIRRTSMSGGVATSVREQGCR